VTTASENPDVEKVDKKNLGVPESKTPVRSRPAKWGRGSQNTTNNGHRRGELISQEKGGGGGGNSDGDRHWNKVLTEKRK